MKSTNPAGDTTALTDYVREGERKAFELGNRGPIKFNADGTLHKEIIDAYRRCGFYVFEGVLSAEELQDLRKDFEQVLDRAPHTKDALVDAKGRPALGAELTEPPFSFARPLGDPMPDRGDSAVKMAEPEPPADAPDFVIISIGSPLQLMHTFLRLYGHPQLLSIAEQIMGSDFTPFSEAIIVKPAELGAFVSWHQDGGEQWDKPDWDEDTHGINFAVQLFGSSAANGVWVVPGTHKQGELDIKAMIEANHGSDRLPGAVPMVCEPGDLVIANRQTLHGSFANTSPDRRVSLYFGFNPRSSVLGVRNKNYDPVAVYDEARIHERSRLIALAIDARQQRFPDEPRYVYQPLAGQEDANRWNETTRESILKDYTVRDLNI